MDDVGENNALFPGRLQYDSEEAAHEDMASHLYYLDRFVRQRNRIDKLKVAHMDVGEMEPGSGIFTIWFSLEDKHSGRLTVPIFTLMTEYELVEG